MSHKTVIGGTAYDVQGGRTLVGGTLYALQGGRVMTEGTLWNVSFGTPLLCFKQDNPCGARVELRYVGQYQMIVADAPVGKTAAGWLELTRNGVLYRLQPGDQVEISCRVEQLGSGGTCGVTFFTDPQTWESAPLAQFGQSVSYTVTEPCYVRVWAKLTGSGTGIHSITLTPTTFLVNGESVPVEI